MQDNAPCIFTCYTTEHAKCQIILSRFLPHWKRIHFHNLLTPGIYGKRVLSINWFVVFCQCLESILLITVPLLYWTLLRRSQGGSSMQNVSQGSTHLAIEQVEPLPMVLVALALSTAAQECA